MTDREVPATEVDTVVVGAGLSGLVAATRLQQAGLSTIVLEATDQVGGRTRSQLIGSQFLDVGGQLVGADYAQLRRLAAGLGLHLQADARLPRWRVQPHAQPELRPTNLSGLQRLARQVHQWLGTISPAAPWQAPEAGSLDQMSLADWLDSAPVGDRTAQFLAHAVSAFALAPARRLSLLHFLVWLLPAGGLSGLWRETRWSIQEGAQELSRRLAARLASPPVLNTPVTAVEQTSSHATVYSASGRAWHARNVALCLPLPPTNAIAFDPPLPADQAALLTEVTSPHVTKVIAAIHPGRAVSPLVHVGDPMLRLATRSKNYALGFAYNDDAALPAKQLRGHLLDTLQLTNDHIAGIVAHPWGEQPYAQGGYPAFAPGQLTRHGPALRAHHRLIHFAGADRSTWPGTMEGAVRDGHRVANEIQLAQAPAAPFTNMP